MLPPRLDEVTYEIRAASFDLLSHLAFVRVRRKAIELRYRVDQPRAPRGQSDGGQWIRDVVRVAAVQPRAPRCQGFACQNGGSFGTSGMFNVGNMKLCWDCTIKYLGIQNLSRDEQLKTIGDFDKSIRP
jgi:hypothetical protein